MLDAVSSNYAICGGTYNSWSAFDQHCSAGKQATVHTADYSSSGTLVLGTPTSVAGTVDADCASLSFAAYVHVPAASARDFQAVIGLRAGSSAARFQTVPCTPQAGGEATDLYCPMPLGGMNLFASVADYLAKANSSAWHITLMVWAVDATCVFGDPITESVEVIPAHPPASTCSTVTPPPPPTDTTYTIECLCQDDTGEAVGTIAGCMQTDVANPGAGAGLLCTELGNDQTFVSGIATTCGAVSWASTGTSCSAPGTYTFGGWEPFGDGG